MKKIIAFTLTVITLILTLASCYLLMPKDKDFSFEELTITMTTQFIKDDYEQDEYGCEEWSYASFNTVAMFERNPIDIVIDELVEADAKTFARFILTDDKIEVNEKDGLVYHSYERFLEGEDYYFITYTFKSSEAFWLVTFACKSKEKDARLEEYNAMAKSVKFGRAKTEGAQ